MEPTGSRDMYHPPTANIRRFDTGSFSADDRFDAWRTMFSAARLTRASAAPGAAFKGAVLGFVDEQGLMFDNVRSDPLVSTFGGDACGILLIGFASGGYSVVQSGSTEVVHDSSRAGLTLIDCDKPIVWTSAVNDVSYLALPKSLVRSAAGVSSLARGEGVVRLPDDGLTPVLRSHLNQMTLQGHRLTGLEAAGALHAAGSLAYALLAALHARGPADQDALQDAFYWAALRQIALNLHDPDLTADGIAAASGCSRAHLYRVFARRQQSVGRTLRTARLRRAHAMLKAGTAATIGLVAFRCGYTDLSAFGKAFRQHFGATASEVMAGMATGRQTP